MAYSTSASPNAPIAIVGLSCRLPGGANSPEQLWEILKGTDDAWSAVPADRFNETAFYHPSRDHTNGTNHQRGGHFIHCDLGDFDHSFFRLSAQQATAMDPQQRMLLEMSFEALESAGWSLESCAGSDMSVFVASFAADFERNLYRDPMSLPTYYLTGVEKAILSNRISHAFDLHGPSMTIDTACSGGLVAVHQACQSLRSGESKAAIVGAANLAMGPDQRIGMSKLHLTSGSGHCYPFDNRGDGYGRGEGCVVLTLKRLDDALRDRDPVRAVLVNTGVNQDGYTPASITYPNGTAQENLIRDTYNAAGLSPLDVPYVEAHGTGTKAGDFEEITAISKVFSPQDSKRSTPLYIGSMKGHIGHTENTSGLASIVKAILILEHLQIPGTVGLNEFKSDLPHDRMCFPRGIVSWPRAHGDDKNKPPRVSVNSFGFGGTNAHAILERTPGQLNTLRSSSKISLAPPRFFAFSANNQESLKSLLQRYGDWIQQHPDISLENLSYTLCHRRSVLSWRYSCVADGEKSLLSKLQAATDVPAISPPREAPAVVFIFTGQGAQWVGMARELLMNGPSSVFRSSIRESRDVLLDLGADWDLEEELLRPSTEATRLNTGQLAQPVTTAVQIALVSMLQSFNIRAGAVLGHSSGEIAAAYAAGHISAQDALLVAYHRGFMGNAAATCGMGPGAMLSVGLSEADAAPLVENLTQGVAGIACVNSPRSVTISGDAGAVDEVTLRIADSNSQRESSILYRRLAVDTAYHSHHMRAVSDKYRARLTKLEYDESEYDKTSREVAFFSSVTGTLKSSGFGPGYWTENLVSPVRFSDAVQALTKNNAGVRHGVFLEIGPHPALAGPVRQCLMDPMALPQMSFDYFPVLQRKVDAITSTLNAAGRLFERGVAVDIQTVSALSIDRDRGIVLLDLPAYPWDHSQKHYFESRISREYRMRRDPYHDLLGVRAMDATSIEPRWRHMIGLSSLPWLAHHCIDRQPIFPGSGYICMAIEAIRQIQNERHPEQHLATITLKDVSFLRGLVVPEIPGHQMELQLSLIPHPGATLTFDFRVTAFWDDGWREHCTGTVSGTLFSENTRDEAHDIRVAHLSSLNQASTSSGSKSFGAEELYRQLTEDGNQYGTTFLGIREYTLEANGSNAFSTVEITDTAAIMPAHHEQPHLIHPATLDSVLHTCLPIVSHRLGRGAVMPTHIEEISVCATSAMPSQPKSILNISTAVRSKRYRTARTDICATAGGSPVLLASGIQMRSLAPHPSTGGKLPNDFGICHKLDWAPDIEFLRAQDLLSENNLTELIKRLLYKHAKPAVLEIGAGDVDLSLAFLGSLGSLGGSERGWPVYEYTAAATEPLQNARKQLVGYSVQYRILAPDGGVYEQGFKPQSYDVVLVPALHSLHQAHSLVKPQGTVIIELKAKVNDDWASPILQAHFNVQLSVYDQVRNSLVVVARPKSQARTNQSPLRITMLTYSQDENNQKWVNDIEDWLQNEFGFVSRGTIQAVNTGSGLDSSTKDSNDWFVVVEDQKQPMLSDPKCFDAIITLLKESNRIVWLSPSDPLSMHQITGVARTAHSENDKLHLTTIHVASKLLMPDSRDRKRLFSILASVLESNCPAREREYQVNEAGTVLVPRLLPEESLDHAVRCGSRGCCQFEVTHFLDDSRIWCLGQEDEAQVLCKSKPATFRRLHDRPVNVADHDVELDTQSFLLSDSSLKGPYCAYAGIVTRLGAAVHELSPGDQVVAIAPFLGANRLVVPRGHVGRLPPGIPSTAGTILLVHSMGVCHALQGLAHLPRHPKILIHGALGALGRATVAVALSIGAVVSVSSASVDEARRITKEIGISPDLIVRVTQSKSPKSIAVGDVDAVVAAAEGLPDQILDYLKPFGRIIVVRGDESGTDNLKNSCSFKVPRNSTIFSCDTSELLSAHPELIPDLLAQAAAALGLLPLLGFNYCVRPVHQVSQAIELIETSTCDAIVLQADRNSRIRVVSSHTPVHGSNWKSEHASYLVAGGLGDLGRRLLGLMAQRGAKHLITLSRNPCSIQGYRSLQEQLQAINPDCILYCLTCDLTQAKSVREAAATIRELHLPPIRGIIQSAALLQDHPLDTMTYEDFMRAATVKIEGTLELEKVFASPELAFFLMLSSAVNILGASGQANYNAGNSVHDATSWARRGGTCRYMSLSPGWIEDAAFTRDNESRMNGLRRTGLRPISRNELSRLFDYALEAYEDKLDTYPSHATVGFDAISIGDATTQNGTVHSPLFCHIRASNSPSIAGHQPPSSTDEIVSFDHAMAKDDPDLILEVVATSLASHLSRLIYVDASRIERFKTSTLDLGIDSLVAIEMRNWIMREFDVPLQSSQILVDQTINALAKKIVSHARASSQSTGQKSIAGDGVITRTPKTTISDSALNESIFGITKNSKNTAPQLPSLPRPALEATLRLFQQSREAIGSTEEQSVTAIVVKDFLAGPGPSLCRILDQMPGDRIAETYERHIYLQRREPLQEYSTFILVHPATAPTHSQTVRATILTAAAFEFARQVAAGTVAQEDLHGTPLDCQSREWLFHAIRRPGRTVDLMERCVPCQTIVVLRRGHAFEMTFPEPGEVITPAAIHAAYKVILDASEEYREDVSSFTADERQAWAQVRSNLERQPENADALSVIDKCAFVVCLDDEAPTTGGERFTQFLLNSPRNRLSNRWFDKPFQLAVAANGVSAGIYEHAKLDGIDCRSLHHHLTRSIFSQSGESLCSSNTVLEPKAYSVRKLDWRIDNAHVEHIHRIQLRGSSYGVIEHNVVQIETLGSDLIRAHRAPSNATAHIIVMLAMYLVDKEIRPAWEVVSLATFLRGRIDWVQTVTPALKAFIEEAAAAVPAIERMLWDKEKQAHLRVLFDAATAAHTFLISSAASGQGYVKNMYALLAAVDTKSEGGDTELPELFRSNGWNVTQRGGPGQDLKIGFMPTVGNHSDEWDEGGFLMQGKRGIYVHCTVDKRRTKFSVSAQPAYAGLVCKELRTAAAVVLRILKFEHPFTC